MLAQTLKAYFAIFLQLHDNSILWYVYLITMLFQPLKPTEVLVFNILYFVSEIEERNHIAIMNCQGRILGSGMDSLPHRENRLHATPPCPLEMLKTAGHRRAKLTQDLVDKYKRITICKTSFVTNLLKKRYLFCFSSPRRSLPLPHYVKKKGCPSNP